MGTTCDITEALFRRKTQLSKRHIVLMLWNCCQTQNIGIGFDDLIIGKYAKGFKP